VAADAVSWWSSHGPIIDKQFVPDVYAASARGDLTLAVALRGIAQGMSGYRYG
jgi:hypothetical protein